MVLGSAEGTVSWRLLEARRLLSQQFPELAGHDQPDPMAQLIGGHPPRSDAGRRATMDPATAAFLEAATRPKDARPAS